MIHVLTEIHDYLLGIGFKEKDKLYTKYLGFGRITIEMHAMDIIFHFYSFDEEPCEIRQIITLDSLYYVHSIESIMKEMLYNFGMMYTRYKIFNEIVE